MNMFELLKRETDALLFRETKFLGIQDKLKLLGENGCYILAILSGFGCSSLDEMLMVTDKLIQKDLLSPTYEVSNNKKLAEELGLTYTYSTTKPENCLFYIKEYYNQRTGYTHFVLCMNDKNYDTLSASTTVKEGIVRSYRVFN